MASVLLVCTGNVCRSPMAEGFLRAALKRRHADGATAVASAGTAGWDGSGAMPEAVRAAGERGVDITGHVARRITIGDVHDADLVVCMAAEHRDTIVRKMPEAEEKCFTLKELVRLLDALESQSGPNGDRSLQAQVARAAEARRDGFAGNPHDEDIVDPLGLPLESYRAIAWELDEWSGRLADRLAGDATAAEPARLDEGDR